jgi:hypothetical protein
MKALSQNARQGSLAGASDVEGWAMMLHTNVFAAKPWGRHGVQQVGLIFMDCV